MKRHTENKATDLLEESGLRKTARRRAVLAVLEGAGCALPVQEIMYRLPSERRMNRVTLYRILDLLVEKELAVRSCDAEGVHRFCLGESGGAGACCHFQCRLCGRSECLPLNDSQLIKSPLLGAAHGKVESVEVRLDGVCEACLETC
jgi:Fe2+ or Zn2+ uptake regulation protein